MALTVGELVGYVGLEDKGWGKGLDKAGQGLDRLGADTTRSMSQVESTVSSALAAIEADLANGLDPTKALADLDKLERELDQGLADMLDEADRFAEELDRAIDEAFDDLDDKARRGGEDAARGLGDGLDGAGRSELPGIGNGFMGVLKGLGWAAAGAAIGSALMSGLESAMDAESAKAKLFAQLGTTPEESERIGRVAGQVYASAYGESMPDVTDAIKSVIQNLDGMRGASEETLTDISKRAMDTATVLDEDVGGVTRAVSQMLRTGMADSAEEAFDILVKGAQEGANKSEDLLDTFNEYSTQFRSLGLDGKKALGLIQQGLKAGARDADTVADAIKEFAIEAVAGGDRVKGGFKNLGLNADEMVRKFAKGGPTAARAFDTVLDKLRNIEDPAKRNAVAVELFGTKAEDLGQALFSLDPSKAEEALGKVGGAAEDAGTKLHDTAANKLEEFKRGIQTKVVDFLGNTALPAAQNFWKSLTEGGLGEKLGSLGSTIGEKLGGIKDKVADWADKNKEKIQELKTKFDETFGGIIETAEEAVTFLSEIWDEWGDEIMTVVSTALGFVLDTIGGVFKAISGIFKTGTALIRGDWKGAWEGIKQIFSGATANIRNIADTVMRNIVGDWGGGWDAMKKRASENLDKIKSVLSDFGGKAKAAMSKAATWLVNTGKDLIRGLVNGIKAMAGKAVDAAKGVVDGAIQGAKNLLGISSPSRVFAEIGKWTVAGFVQGLDAEKGKAKTSVDRLVAMVKDAFKQAPDAPDALVEWVAGETKRLEAVAKKREEIIEAIANAKKYANDIANQMRDFASVADLGLGEGAGAGDIISGLNDKLQAIKSFANDIKTLAERGLNKTTLRQIIEAGPEKGASLAEMLVGADGSEIKAINKAQKQIDKVSKQMGKNSADALYDVGKKAGEGFLKGLQGQLKELESMMAKIARAVVDAVKKELKVKSPSRVFAEIGDNTMLGFIRGIVGKQDATVAAMNQVVSKAVAAGSGMAPTPGTVQPMTGPSAAPAYGGAYGQAPPSNGVVVNMPNAVIREEADISRLGAEFAFNHRGRG